MDTKQELQVKQKRELGKKEESTIPGARLCANGRHLRDAGRAECHP